MTILRTIPEIQFKEYLGSGEFKIEKLQYFLERITYGFTNPMPEEESGPYMLTAKDITDGKIQYETCRRTSIKAYKELLTDKSRPEIGDILLTKDGTLGRVALVDNPNCCINQSVALLQVNNKIFPEFLFWLLRTPKYHSQMISNAGGSTIKHIYITVVDKMKIAVPPLSEQQKIASFFTAIDQKISQLKQKKSLLEQYKKGMMQKIFSQEIRFRDEKGRKFPKWEQKRLGDIFEEVKEVVGDRGIKTYSISAGKGFISQEEKFGKDISGQQNKKYIVLNEGQFSYNKGNSKTYKYGCIYLNDRGKQIAVPNVFISFKLNDLRMSPLFFAMLFESHYLDKGLRKIISSSARMDGLLNVNKQWFFRLQIPCPNYIEQRKIADFLSAIDNKINHTQTQIEKAELWKKGLLQKMFV